MKFMKHVFYKFNDPISLNNYHGEYASCGSPISIGFFFCIVLYQESTSAEEFVSNAQPFSRIIDSKFIKLFIYPFVRMLYEKHLVAQGLKYLTTTQETGVRFLLDTFFF